jgi:hypothetical protein
LRANMAGAASQGPSRKAGNKAPDHDGLGGCGKFPYLCLLPICPVDPLTLGDVLLRPPRTHYVCAICVLSLSLCVCVTVCVVGVCSPAPTHSHIHIPHHSHAPARLSSHFPPPAPHTCACV